MSWKSLNTGPVSDLGSKLIVWDNIFAKYALLVGMGFSPKMSNFQDTMPKNGVKSLRVLFLAKMTPKYGYGFCGVSRTPPPKLNQSIPPPGDKSMNSCLLLDGWVSDYLSVSRGMQHDCLLSALPFILAEFMSTNIRNDKIINGIKFRNYPNIKTSVYWSDKVLSSDSHYNTL